MNKWSKGLYQNKFREKGFQFLEVKLGKICLSTRQDNARNLVSILEKFKTRRSYTQMRDEVRPRWSEYKAQPEEGDDMPISANLKL